MRAKGPALLVIRKICFWAVAFSHVALPIAGVVWFGAPRAWSASALAFAAAMSIVLSGGTHRLLAVLLGLLSLVWMLTNVLLAASFYMQGSGFNDAFFYHLQASTLSAALQAYTLPSSLAVLLLALAALWPWTSPTMHFTASTRSVLGGMLMALAILSSTPWHSYHDYRSRSAEGSMDAAAVFLPVETNTQAAADNSTTDAPTAQPAEAKNILLIYAESLERVYFDAQKYGDLLPNLRQLGARAQRFTDIHQLPGTSWTIAGLVASQCGFPLLVSNPMASNSTMAAAQNPFPDKDCLGDILAARGFKTVYMGGADLAFAGKGTFLRAHGYQEVQGKHELQSELEDPSYLARWGLYDDSLFELATDKLRELEQAGQPWFLTVLTLDTHHPEGDPSASCEPLPSSREPMSNSIYCSDQLISHFIRNAIDIVDLQRTVIVLFSDHLSLRNSLADKLRRDRNERRLTFMIFDDRAGGAHATPGSHFDIASTILDVAGVPMDRPVGHGLSLFSPTAAGRAGKPEYAGDTRTPRALGAGNPVTLAGVTASRRDLSLTIGNLKLAATRTGFTFEHGMFLAVLNDRGEILDAVYADDYEKLLSRYGGRFVVGISLLEGDPGPTVFAGRLSSDPSSIVIQPLVDELHIPAEAFQAWLRSAP